MAWSCCIGEIVPGHTTNLRRIWLGVTSGSYHRCDKVNDEGMIDGDGVHVFQNDSKYRGLEHMVTVGCLKS